MGTRRGGGGDVKGQFRGPIEIADSEKIVETLYEAINHVENNEAEYWIRTALQQLVVEQSVKKDSSQ